MKQTLHLLIVDRDRRNTLTTAIGSRWLLPVMTCDERTRAAPPIARWCAGRGIVGDVAGQWLGRVTPAAMDWLVAFAARTAVATDAALEWTSIDTLVSTPSVLDYQQWAIDRAFKGGAPSVDGPFGSLAWPDEARAWIESVTGAPVDSLTAYRAGAHEVVVGADCGGRRVYAKGLTVARAVEARVTRALAAIEPESFARTLALENRGDGSSWWLTAACPGTPGGDLHRVSRALARIQQRVIASGRPCELPRLDLPAAARWAIDMLRDSPFGDVVRRRCACALRADVPASWIPMDLDPANILSDGDRVRFIDVDDSFVGPAPLAMAALAARVGDPALYATYERSWSAPLVGLDRVALETASTVVQFWLGWQRLERHLARGEVVVDRELAARRIRDRLVKAIDGKSPWQGRQDDRGA